MKLRQYLLLSCIFLLILALSGCKPLGQATEFTESKDFVDLTGTGVIDFALGELYIGPNDPDTIPVTFKLSDSSNFLFGAKYAVSFEDGQVKRGDFSPTYKIKTHRRRVVYDANGYPELEQNVKGSWAERGASASFAAKPGDNDVLVRYNDFNSHNLRPRRATKIRSKGGYATLHVSYCGDGSVYSSKGGLNVVIEECDDGNTNNGDGCSSTCTLEQVAPPVGPGRGAICGDGIVREDLGEECDPGADPRAWKCDGTGYSCVDCKCFKPVAQR